MSYVQSAGLHLGKNINVLRLKECTFTGPCMYAYLVALGS